MKQQNMFVDLMWFVPLLAIAVYTTGCGAVMSPARGSGYIQISADSEGMQSFGDVMNGMITNGKASPDTSTPHWATRQLQEAERTKRSMSPGFFQKMFGSNEPTETKGS